MNLHDLREARWQWLEAESACYKRIAGTDDPHVLEEAGDRLDKLQLARDTNAPIFALLDGFDELKAGLDKLEGKVNQRTVYLGQQAALKRDRLNALDSTTEHNASGGLALAAGLKALTKETAEWIDELQAEDARDAARLDELEEHGKRAGTHLDRCIDLLDRLAENVETWMGRTEALAKRVAELEAAPELLRLPGGHGLLPDDYDREDIPF